MEGPGWREKEGGTTRSSGLLGMPEKVVTWGGRDAAPLKLASELCLFSLPSLAGAPSTSGHQLLPDSPISAALHKARTALLNHRHGG